MLMNLKMTYGEDGAIQCSNYINIFSRLFSVILADLLPRCLVCNSYYKQASVEVDEKLVRKIYDGQHGQHFKVSGD